MRTRYYCTKCDKYFEEEELPNINKKHFCGSHVRIDYHLPKEEKEQ